MSRIPLRQGEIVVAPNCKYIIDTVIGDGANGVVYDAHYYDSINLPHTVKLKECYPYGDSIARNGTELKWENEEIKQTRLAAFKHSYEKLMVRQNSNFTVHVFDLFETNGTSYVAMDANDGLTFDKTNSLSLEEVLKTVKLLAYVVGEYHKNGYLHLDVKPSNFLVYPRPSEHIVLFDLDTVTAIKDIERGIIKCVPYSKDWAAPEQMLGKISKLCPATDIYSIGAILFQKIMGRVVTNDDTGIFADWVFTGEMFEKVNPKIKRLLCEIFRKTLAANVKRRYKSADELIEVLDKAIEAARQKQYIVSDRVVSGINFVGRREDIQTIHERFADGARAVFVHGFMGIGKTELARKYAEIYAPEYDAVIFRFYSNSLSHLLSHISVANSDKEIDFESLKKLCNSSKVLFIIDNFDVDDDKDLETLLEVNADFLITTRNDFSEYFASPKISIYEIEELPTSELFVVFKNEYGRETTAEEEEIIIDIIERFQNWTFIVPIVAKYLLSSGTSIKEYSKIIERNGFSSFGDDSEKIRFRKDGQAFQKTQMDMLRYCFNMEYLTEKHKSVLRNLFCLKENSHLTKSKYKLFTSESNLNALNELVFLNWVKYDKQEDKLNLHPAVCDLIQADLEITNETVPGIYAYVQKQFDRLKDYNSIQEATDFTYALLIYTNIDDTEENQKQLYIKLGEFIVKYFFTDMQGMYKLLFESSDESTWYVVSSSVLPKMRANYFEWLQGQMNEDEIGSIMSVFISIYALNLAIHIFYFIERKINEDEIVSNFFEFNFTENDNINNNNIEIKNAIMNLIPLSMYVTVRERCSFDKDGNFLGIQSFGLGNLCLKDYSYNFYTTSQAIKTIHAFQEVGIQSEDISDFLTSIALPQGLHILDVDELYSLLNERIIVMDNSLGRFRFWETDRDTLLSYNLLSEEEYTALYQSYKKEHWTKKAKAWHESVEQAINKTSNPFPIYKLLLNWEYNEQIIKNFQTAELVKHNIIARIADDERLSNEERKQLLLFIPSEQLSQQRFPKTNRQVQWFMGRYKHSLTLYANCLSCGLKAFPYQELPIRIRIDILISALIIRRCLRIDIVDVEGLLLEEIREENIPYFYSLLNIADLIRQGGQIKRSQQIKNKILDIVEQADLSSLSEIDIQLLDFIMTPLAIKYHRQVISDNMKRYITSLRCFYHLDLLSSSEVSQRSRNNISYYFLDEYIAVIALDAYKKLHGNSNITKYELKLSEINEKYDNVITAYENLLNDNIDLLIQYSNENYGMIFNYPANSEYKIQTIHHISPYWAMEFYESLDCQVWIGILYLVAMCYDSISITNPLTEGLMMLTENDNFSISKEELDEVCNNLIRLQPKAKQDIEKYHKS
ncbi:MAG: hypothetical protein ACI4MS_08405 [Candidatus Coproplasma sp.]